jgi:hypothetical protein
MGPVPCVLAALAMVVSAGARPPNIIWLQSDSFDGRLLDPTNQAGYFHKCVGRGRVCSWQF